MANITKSQIENISNMFKRLIVVAEGKDEPNGDKNYIRLLEIVPPTVAAVVRISEFNEINKRRNNFLHASAEYVWKVANNQRTNGSSQAKALLAEVDKRVYEFSNQSNITKTILSNIVADPERREEAENAICSSDTLREGLLTALPELFAGDFLLEPDDE